MFTISLQNYNCKIKITSDSDGTPITAGKVVIQRQEVGGQTWYTIYTRFISTLTDLNYVFVDRYNRSGYTYNYKITPYTGSELDGWIAGTAVDAQIKCSFDSVYIYDRVDEYFLSLNLDYDVDPNEDYKVQKLLQVKYPTIINNSLSSFQSGYVEGLLLPLDSNGNYTIDNSFQYKQNFKSYMKNGLKKYVKTPRGDAWYVFIKPEVKINKSNFQDACTVRFEFVEAADPPQYDS